jgi:tripartite-type tricarboxylate transporter receptor subunit TctC
MKLKLQGLTAVLLLVLSVGVSLAQSYPTKPIRFIVPNAPSGGLNIIARLIAPILSENMGQTVIVDNRPGASGAIGMELTARARPDGHTIVIFSASQVISSILQKTGYDLLRDFVMVTQTSAAPYLMVVNPGLPTKSVNELVSYAKSNPGKLNYGSAGNGSLQHLSMELFAAEVGVKMVHVPYKGSGEALPDLMSGQTHVMMSTIMSFMPQVRSKVLRALAVTSAQRSTVIPEVPTMIEEGIPGFLLTQWHGVLAPAETPLPIVERLHREIAKAMRYPKVTSVIATDGTDLVESSPRKAAVFLKAEHERWDKVIKQSGMQAK